jgi:hypothetical protein
MEPDDEDWLGLELALAMIVQARRVGSESARSILAQAFASRRVRSRYPRVIRVDRERVKIEYLSGRPGEWDGPVDPVGLMNAETGVFQAFFDDASEGPIEISASDLKKWLARPARGPKPGTVSRHAAHDKILFQEIERRVHEGKAASPTGAARQLVGEGKVAGASTEDSRARRLARAYNKAR